MVTDTKHLLDVYAQLDVEPVSASGVYLYTSDGRRILDLYGGHAVASLGYAHPSVVEVLADQAKKLTFQTNAVPLNVRERAATRLARFAPDGLDHVFFVNSGAEANENALRISFLGTSDRKAAVAVEHGFHGRTAAAGAVTWGASRWYAYPKTPFPVDFVQRNDIDSIDKVIDEQTAVVIAEPVQGVAGAFELAPKFLRALRERCDATGTLLVFDEVQCGVGRSGFAFACENSGVTPDILTTAKGLGAGFPLGAVLMTESVAGLVSKGVLGTTFGGGPMACALVESVINTIEVNDLLDNVGKISDLIRGQCCVGPVKSIRGMGLLLGLICSEPAVKVRDCLLKKNILVGTSADPNVIRLMPPLILGEAHVKELSEALKTCMNSST